MGKKQTRKLGLRRCRNKKRTLRNKRPVQKGGGVFQALIVALSAALAGKSTLNPELVNSRAIVLRNMPPFSTPTGGTESTLISPGSTMQFLTPSSFSAGGGGGGAVPSSPVEKSLMERVWGENAENPEKDYAIIGEATNDKYIEAIGMVDAYLAAAGNIKLDLLPYYREKGLKGDNIDSLYNNNRKLFIKASQEFFKGVISILDKDGKQQICIAYPIAKKEAENKGKPAPPFLTLRAM